MLLELLQQHDDMYKPEHRDIPTRLRPLIPDFKMAIPTPDDYVNIPPPDGGGNPIGTVFSRSEFIKDEKYGVDEGITNALKKGSKEWGRSKIMIVGEGRAGKTAFSNCVIGKDFTETSSTIGIHQLTCDVKYAAAGGGAWGEYSKPDKEWEAAVASMIARMDMAAAAESKTVTEKAKPDAPKIAKPAEKALSPEEKKPSTDSSKTPSANPSTPASIVAPAVSQENPTSEVKSAELKPTTVPTVSSKLGGVSAPVGSKELDAPRLPRAHATPPAIPQPQIDDDLVMKCLADSIHTESKLILSVFDYGGQSVFNVIHHFFLTRYGVYCLVFNMEWLVCREGNIKEQCLEYLKFWMNSVVVHTLNAETNETAPIALVGTRKDKVSNPGDHQKISTILYEAFSSSLAWPFVLENERAEGANGLTNLFFFPVDNTNGRSDPTVVQLMNLVEETIDTSSYVHNEIPLTWLKTVDALTSSNKAYMSYDEAAALAIDCGVEKDVIPKMLGLLHEMGTLMWFEEEGLRNVIILDPVAYFVSPCTIIICKHSPTGDDPTHHLLDVHKTCRKKKNTLWQRMTNYGIVNDELMRLLLSDFVDQYDGIVRLMIKFGLLVPLKNTAAVDSDSTNCSSSSDKQEYLVPALLPVSSTPLVDWTDQKCSTCFFVFTSSEEFCNFPTLSKSDLSKYGFLPSGLFERLVGKAVLWSQHTSDVTGTDSCMLFKDEALLYYGNQRFKLKAINASNCIQVDIEGGNPKAVCHRLGEQINAILCECMKSLKCFAALPYSPDVSSNSSCSPGDADFLLIPLQRVIDVIQNHSVLNRPGGRRLLNDSDARTLYHCWLPQTDLLEAYHVFISYRWGAVDSMFTECLFDRFTMFSVGSNHRAVDVFLDIHRLKEGRMFQSDFATALSSSLVVVPIVSKSALMRMLSHDESMEDNVLIEWILSIECYYSKNSRVSRLYPIFFGSRDEFVGPIGDLFAEGIVEDLPAIIPSASIALVVKMMKSLQLDIRPEIHSWTVRNVILQMKKFLCMFAWNVAAKNKDVVAESSAEIIKVLQTAIADATSAAGSDTPTFKPDVGAIVKPADASSPVAATPTNTTPTAQKGDATVPLKEIISRIRDELGLESSSISDVIRDALDTLDDPKITESCKGLSNFKAKATYIAEAVGIDLSP